MYKKILVPLDGSKRAEKILSHVEELAQRYSARVILFRVVRYPQFIDYTGTTIDLYREKCEELREKAESRLSLLAGEFKEKGIAAEAHVVAGPIVREIVDVAERENVDLIAISSHGRTGLGRVFYGSVAAGVLHQVDRPILVIRSLGKE